MKDSESETATDELEVTQMVGINPGSRVDLEGVVIVCRVFEQSITWVENLM